jgi:hypothetical protein
MKNFVKLFGIIALVAVIVFPMTSCKGKSDSSSGPDSVSDADSASATISSINNWDTFIQEYEDFFLNEYVPLLNKMKSGDFSVFAQMEPLETKFSEWPQRMQNFILSPGRPTAAQERRLEELNKKIEAALKN